MGMSNDAKGAHILIEVIVYDINKAADSSHINENKQISIDVCQDLLGSNLHSSMDHLGPVTVSQPNLPHLA